MILLDCFEESFHHSSYTLTEKFSCQNVGMITLRIISVYVCVCGVHGGPLS